MFYNIDTWFQLDVEFVVDHAPHLHEGELKLLVGEDCHLAALRVHPRQIVLLVVESTKR